ncbi:hypothetical protein [Leptolyngbya sp. FACHB-261]|uniref:hypothetical protein n=1 Tax=Leptolyngbya sp. FACHB-261 TaxID=2692806 RepID=UPI00168212BF|nr:hypothetical protein [Leptolyngbya sp. FACHB-261]MBD2102511.1 hypothetical protein [Leptolyngbya sp. FACHB-261]
MTQHDHGQFTKIRTIPRSEASRGKFSENGHISPAADGPDGSTGIESSIAHDVVVTRVA